MKSDWSKLEVLFQIKHDTIVGKRNSIVDEIQMLEEQIRQQRSLFRSPDDLQHARKHQGNIRMAGALQEHRVQELNQRILQLLVQKEVVQKQIKASFQKLTSVQELRRRETRLKAATVGKW